MATMSRRVNMLTVGVRELKNHLAQYLRTARAGEDIIVTEHGKPIAILHELSRVELNSPPEERLASVAAEGAIRLPEPGATIDLKTKPMVHQGKPASEILLEDRR